MAAHSFLVIGSDYFLACREGYLPELAAIFRDDELQTDLGGPVYALGARQMRERLDVLGFTMATARRAISIAYEQARAHDEEEPESFEAWLDELSRATQDGETTAAEVPTWTAWSVDPRLIVRLAIDVVGDDLTVGLDLSDVVRRGYVQATPDFCSAAYNGIVGQRAHAPAIILTEGSSDAEFLDLTIRVLAPHLHGYMRFMDYNFRPEGSTSSLVRALRAFAAAGITNRVVGLFDNDAAAAEALTTLDVAGLPPNFKVCQLPNLPLATRYPALGPNGLSVMDVNGLAASIEMYFGEDVLRVEGKDLRPVQWRGYVNKVGRYQGELLNKGELQDAFRRKANDAIRRESIESQDWSGMKLIIRLWTQACA